MGATHLKTFVTFHLMQQGKNLYDQRIVSNFTVATSKDEVRSNEKLNHQSGAQMQCSEEVASLNKN